VRTQVKYYVSLPAEEAHHGTHPTRGAYLMAQRINPFVAQKISEFIGEGMTDVQEVKRAFKHYVNSVLCAQNPPSPDAVSLYTSPSPRDGLLSRMPSSA